MKRMNMKQCSATIKVFAILAVYLCWMTGKVYPQSSNRNYVLTRTYTNAGETTWQDKIDYFDGLGRPEQSTLKRVSPLGHDLTTLQEYDSLDRKSNQWMSTVIQNNNGQYVSPATIKSKAIAMYGDSKPYAMPVYESSPLNRLREEYGAGEDWYTNSRSVKTKYMVNIAGNDTLNCICYAMSGAANDTILTLTRVKNYASSVLFVTRTNDEDGNTVFEFKDKLEQVVLTRQIQRDGNSKEIYDTYYIYDDFGNRVAVLPPKASDAFRASSSTSWNSNTNQTLQQYAFLYKFDSRHRQTAKKLPSCSWTLYVYDKGDRLIFSQDGNQRKRNEWAFSIPDALGRECFSGICKNLINPFADPLAGAVVEAAWRSDAATTIGTGSHKGYYLSGLSLVSPVILHVNYYDDYSFMGKNSIPNSTDVNVQYDSTTEAEGFGKRYVVSAKGLLTGTLTALLDNSAASTYLYSVMYYDCHGRLIQAKSSSHLQGGIEKEYFAYNFVGQPTQRKHIHSATGKTSQTELYVYTYDHAGRLLITTHKLNENNSVTLTDNEYDELGRLKSNKCDGNANLKTEYKYNVRSWLKTITNTLFSQTLYYQNSYGGNTPSYNGNISAMHWTTYADKKRGYTFNYDNLARLTKANYLENDIVSTHYGTSYNYDKHGNITSLTRNGRTGTTAFGVVDELSLTYNGNQLIKATDVVIDPTLSQSADFKDGTNQSAEYTYDRNGNMTQDLNKGISEISYNSLNLPDKLVISNSLGSATNTYLYSADGKKLNVTMKWTTSNSKSMDYAGNKFYENGSLKRILVDGGYIENSVYYYYLNDHLGNNRMVAKSDGTVVQTNHYYPFGMSFAEGIQNSNQPFKYNGKELDTERGLNLYDYVARCMDAALGRFTIVDPLAEKYYSWSTYVYCANNPIKFIDPDGKGWNEAWPFLKSSVSATFSIGLRAEASAKVRGIGAKLGVNMGSVEFSKNGKKITSGVSATLGIVGVKSYDNSYKLNSSTSVKEKGNSVSFLIWEEDYKESTFYDSRGKYYEEKGKKETVETTTSADLDISAHAIVGVDVSINLSKVKDFIVNLFK